MLSSNQKLQLSIFVFGNSSTWTSNCELNNSYFLLTIIFYEKLHMVVQATRVLPSILSCSEEIHKGSVKVSKSVMTIGKRILMYILIDYFVVAVYRNQHSQWRIQDFTEVGRQLSRGTPTYDFAKFPQKLHEIEIIWTPGGGRNFPCTLLRSATDFVNRNGHSLSLKFVQCMLY